MFEKKTAPVLRTLDEIIEDLVRTAKEHTPVAERRLNELVQEAREATVREAPPRKKRRRSKGKMRPE